MYTIRHIQGLLVNPDVINGGMLTIMRLERLLLNALIHRNYLKVGSEVHIDMFDDRIEIYSSDGGLTPCLSLNFSYRIWTTHN